MLIPQYAPLGSLKKPLCGLVLHYGNGGPNGLPSEASYICVSQSEGIKTPKVNVYVPKSSLRTRTRAYKPLGGNITVSALLFVETELDAEAVLTMMAPLTHLSLCHYTCKLLWYVCLYIFDTLKKNPFIVHSSGAG